MYKAFLFSDIHSTQNNAICLFCQCYQSTWGILAAVFPLKSRNDLLLFALQSTGVILHSYVVVISCNIKI